MKISHRPFNSSWPFAGNHHILQATASLGEVVFCTGSFKMSLSTIRLVSLILSGMRSVSGRGRKTLDGSATGMRYSLLVRDVFRRQKAFEFVQ